MWGGHQVQSVMKFLIQDSASQKAAAVFVRRTVERLSKNYTVPRDNEANYYLGYVLEQQDKLEEAEDQYWKATWTTSYQSAAYLALFSTVSSMEQNHPIARS